MSDGAHCGRGFSALRDGRGGFSRIILTERSEARQAARCCACLWDSFASARTRQDYLYAPDVNARGMRSRVYDAG